MVRYHLKCCVIVNALIECKIAFFKVVRQSLKSFYFTEKVRPLCLPRRGMILQYFDQIGTIAGWGGTGGNTKWAANLAEVDVTIFNNDICRKIMHIQGKLPWTLNKGFDTISE